MELITIPFSEVQTALQEAKEAWADTDKFNTHGHSFEDINALVPETQDLKHIKPGLFSTLYQHWVPLIMSSQGAEEWHTFELPRYLAFETTEMYQVWIARASSRSSIFNGLVEMFPKQSSAGMKTEELFGRHQKWFLRLDSCSTKDGENGMKPITSVHDLIRQLCTSMRGRRAILDTLEDGVSKPVVYLIPYNEQMDPSREFRVFCPPPGSGIAAISQYRWTSPFAVNNMEDAVRVANRVRLDSLQIHSRIMETARQLPDVLVHEMMEREGFTFDVLSVPDGSTQLVEINPFGAMSGCGSCLFHWLRDSKSLYGLTSNIPVKMVLPDSLLDANTH
ncbi:hypothetical protein H112_05243 [Trichophyton rubrum D6]|uniref:Cell division cycle protein 123 n=4 Tax=Trichophyton TaxID=5550 RepID=A0A178EPI7_TRIRU|nr:uncharacterized protein TERG_02995 [Trichophyton rubrum CBS 118892]EZF20208.1 hypothetical protein H100_05265 [Trichophyton rubrum MR850]EZF40772.1 hypothetical protein H102_05255 [Trichophyton rubrum CBS 100081]EZF51389.1 hypothetical protein H103_05256 [Trichophyton rubrum CBS 288.86]EZF62070.1 hypothetical protein H104_05246 [Trichophyton rubrum CBS 289.86]EZF72663.1 hypothetical protein H105_05274 [Trichophyton soudanense CBS 452.61]EZF83443.1 hypothetical protein H110_05253 [Trichophy